MEKRKREEYNMGSGSNKRFKPGILPTPVIDERFYNNYFNQRSIQMGFLNNFGLNNLPSLNAYDLNHFGINYHSNYPGFPRGNSYHASVSNNVPFLRGKKKPNYHCWQELKSKRKRFSKNKETPGPSKDVAESEIFVRNEKTITISDDSDVEFSESANKKLPEEVIVLDDDISSERPLPDSDVTNSEKDSDPVILNHNTSNECISDSLLIFSKSLHDFNMLICSDGFLQKECGEIKINLMQTYCLICQTGVMGLCNFVTHLQGKNHRKALGKITDKLIKIVFCKHCDKLILISDDENSNCVEPLNCSIKDILLPSSGLRYLQKTPPMKKITNSIRNFHLLIRDIDEDYGMKDIFDELLKYSSNQEFNLVNIYLKVKEKIALVSFRKRKDCVIMESNSEFIRHKSIRATDSQIEEFFRNSSKCLKWAEGDLSPMVTEIFSSKLQLENLVNNSLLLMNSVSQNFDILARNISQDLRSDLRSGYTVHSVEFFGSRVTGLSYNDSDFDIALLLDPMNKNYVSKVSMIASCLKMGSFFKVTRVISFAKVPIVRLIHKKTNSKCDVSLNNINGVYNSQLLRFYLDYDPRVKWLVVAVKMWASSNLIHGSFRFTSYALFWMVVYFLMQPKHSVVPTVSLLNAVPSGNRLICPGRSLCIDVNSVKRFHLGTAKHYQLNKLILLKDFFKFYATLNPSLVIDPYSGQRIHRREVISRLSDTCTQEEYLKSVEKINFYTMILLDPISGDNICPNVRDELVSLLNSLCKDTIDLISNYTYI